MSPFAQIVIITVAIGLVVGGIATLAARGRGLILYIVASVAGAFVFPAGILPPLGIMIGGDPIVAQIGTAVVGALFGALMAWLILRFR